MKDGSALVKNVGQALQDEEMILVVDNLARRYGILPFDVVAGQTMYQFNFNVAVMINAMAIETRIKQEASSDTRPGPQKDGPKTYREWGIKRTVIKK